MSKKGQLIEADKFQQGLEGLFNLTRLAVQYGRNQQPFNNFGLLGNRRARDPGDDYSELIPPDTAYKTPSRLRKPPEERKRSPSNSSSSSSDEEEDNPNQGFSSISILKGTDYRSIELIFPVYALYDSSTGNQWLALTTDLTSYDVCWPILKLINTVPTPTISNSTSREYLNLTTIYRNVKIDSIHVFYMRDSINQHDLFVIPSMSVSVTPDAPRNYNNKVIEWAYDNYCNPDCVYYQMETHRQLGIIGSYVVPDQIIQTTNSNMGDWRETQKLSELDLSLNIGFKTTPFITTISSTNIRRIGCIMVNLICVFSNFQTSLG